MLSTECPGVEGRSSAGKVIGVQSGELTRRIRIDGPFKSRSRNQSKLQPLQRTKAAFLARR